MNKDNIILLASMQEIQRQVDALHTISMVCLIIAILLLIAAIVEFFLLDIFKIILIKTGKAAKMGIKELEAENAGSGGLKSRSRNKNRHNMWNTASPLEMPKENQAADSQQKSGTEKMSDREKEGARNPSPPENTGAGETSLLEGLGSNATTVLEQQVQYDYSDANITLPLQEEAPVQIGRFQITRNIMMIHTDEVI